MSPCRQSSATPLCSYHRLSRSHLFIYLFIYSFIYLLIDWLIDWLIYVYNLSSLVACHKNRCRSPGGSIVAMSLAIVPSDAQRSSLQFSTICHLNTPRSKNWNLSLGKRLPKNCVRWAMVFKEGWVENIEIWLNNRRFVTSAFHILSDKCCFVAFSGCSWV